VEKNKTNIVIIAIVLIVPIIFFSIIIVSTQWFNTNENEIVQKDISEWDHPEPHPFFDNPVLMILTGIGIAVSITVAYVFYRVHREGKIIAAYKKSVLKRDLEKIEKGMDKE